LKLKSADFQRHTRSQTLAQPTHASEILYQTAAALLEEFALVKAVRLVGVAASGLQPATQPVQAELFPETGQRQERKWEQVDRAVDAIADRFGGAVVTRGTLKSSKSSDQG
jgi:DNA polymerase-4